ncbi:hypothetical protein QFC20_005323 [Naganishia adeliensis]|uniref:Uncharacterized protein n=1 Tax=Naganishia adeliensis TaxID=92952 RepID=A0ACC2VQX2_9TREE|nr:hypothetical protein QFC20_005323 [Naganishia adeliensis]
MARSPAKPLASARDKVSHLNRLLPLAASDSTAPRANEQPDDRTRRLHEEYDLDDDEEAPAGYGLGTERDDTEGQDWEGDPEEEEEVEEEDDPDEEVGEDYDSPNATPRSRRGLVGSRSSAQGTPSSRNQSKDIGTPRSRAGKGTPTRTPRQRKPPAWMIDPSLPGFVRPTAADAYFLAAARPKRKRVELSDSEDEEDQGKGEGSMLGTPHRSKHANRDAAVRNAEQVMPVEQRRQYLQAYNRARYAEWQSLLHSTGNNLIFFGHGSKRELLEDFVTTTLQPLGHCISTNGLYPGLKIRDVLLEIAIAFPEVEQCPVPDGLARGIDKLAHKIYAYFLPSSAIPTDGTRKTPSFKTSTKPLFLLLHNIDGPGMKNERSLDILSLLASSPRIHLVTSFDHVHTPILFSTTLNNTPKHQYKKGGWTGIPPPPRGFNWAWIQAAAYAPYTVEMEYVRQSAAYSGKALAHDEEDARHGADVTEEGALRILASVPPMAKRLFKLLATKQLAALSTDAQSSKAFPGANAAFAPPFAIDSDILQALAKDKFIAREEERYNTQLMEYKDHGVIMEHALDAENRTGRWLWIPFSKDSLTRIVKTLHDVEA